MSETKNRIIWSIQKMFAPANDVIDVKVTDIEEDGRHVNVDFTYMCKDFTKLWSKKESFILLWDVDGFAKNAKNVLPLIKWMEDVLEVKDIDLNCDNYNFDYVFKSDPNVVNSFDSERWNIEEIRNIGNNADKTKEKIITKFVAQDNLKIEDNVQLKLDDELIAHFTVSFCKYGNIWTNKIECEVDKIDSLFEDIDTFFTELDKYQNNINVTSITIEWKLSELSCNYKFNMDIEKNGEEAKEHLMLIKQNNSTFSYEQFDKIASMISIKEKYKDWDLVSTWVQYKEKICSSDYENYLSNLKDSELEILYDVCHWEYDNKPLKDIWKIKENLVSFAMMNIEWTENSDERYLLSFDPKIIKITQIAFGQKPDWQLSTELVRNIAKDHDMRPEEFGCDLRRLDPNFVAKATADDEKVKTMCSNADDLTQQIDNIMKKYVRMEMFQKRYWKKILREVQMFIWMTCPSENKVQELISHIENECKIWYNEDTIVKELEDEEVTKILEYIANLYIDEVNKRGHDRNLWYNRCKAFMTACIWNDYETILWWNYLHTTEPNVDAS